MKARYWPLIARVERKDIEEAFHVRLAVGSTRDVVIVEGVGRLLELDEFDHSVGDGYAAQAGWDPRPFGGGHGLHPRRAGSHPGLARGG